MSPFSAADRFQSANLSLIDSLSAYPSDSMFDEANLTSDISDSTISSVQFLLNATLNTAPNGSITTENSTVPESTGGRYETLRIVKISLLAVIFVLILCGNVFVLLALNVSTFALL